MIFWILVFTFPAAGASRWRNGRQIVGRDAEDDGAKSSDSRTDGECGRFIKGIVDGGPVKKSPCRVLMIVTFKTINSRLSVLNFILSVAHLDVVILLTLFRQTESLVIKIFFL